MDDESKSGPNAINAGLSADLPNLKPPFVLDSHRGNNHGAAAIMALSGSVNKAVSTRTLSCSECRTMTWKYLKTTKARACKRRHRIICVCVSTSSCSCIRLLACPLLFPGINRPPPTQKNVSKAHPPSATITACSTPSFVAHDICPSACSRGRFR
jgi:hypothetical protein